MGWEWGEGLLGSLVIAGAAYWRRSLSASGLIAAIMLGTMMYVLGSLAWFGTLIAFFVSSSLLSKLKQRRKAAAESGYAKGGRRDAGQVAANGALGLLLCIGNAVWPHPAWWAAYIGVTATVNADTWATEIGGLSSQTPRSIVHGRRVPAGTSGGVTALGISASLLGGLFIGIASWVFIQWGEPPVSGAGEAVTSGCLRLIPLLWIGAVAGLIGSLTDSWLGATFQVMYRCSDCGKEVEKPVHCYRPAMQVRGLRWMTNDAVNAVSSLIGGAAALLLCSL